KLHTTDSSVSGGEDIYRTLGSELGSGGAVYAAFDVSVSALAPVTESPSQGHYFVHFYDVSTGTSSNGQQGRVYVLPLSGSDFTFGGGTGSASAATKWATGFTFGTTHRIVVEYQYAGSARLWVDPVDSTSTSLSYGGAASIAIDAIAIRQQALAAGVASVN